MSEFLCKRVYLCFLLIPRYPSPQNSVNYASLRKYISKDY